MSSEETVHKQRIFAVDIGTRSVIGLLGYFENGKIKVEYGEIEYHKDRVMIDGQIQDIDGVAESIKTIKDKLEQKNGEKLTEVAIAAAGRSLITARSEFSLEVDENNPIEKHLVDAMEMECLQNIYTEMLEESQEMKDFFCIGHTVVHYYLNDKVMLGLIGHKGRSIKVDLIATFLPRTVVESLYASVSKVGLDATYLTLEPIAAIEVAVPTNMRLLNIALVDIGAGTSDIAITNDGTVVAYAMTSTAGDEITEAIVKALLMDFDSAEKLKCNLREEHKQKFKDIFGIEHEMASDEILDLLSDVIDLVAKNIADNILDKNGKSPIAVFLTGGGSRIPRLDQAIANYLNLPVERVSIRDLSSIPNISVSDFELNGPEVITPIGILAKAISHLGKDFVEVFVNGESVKLINTKTVKVIDAMMLIGFNPRNLIAKKEKSFEVFINGRKKTFFGINGEPGEIYVNRELSSIKTPIKRHDEIVVLPARHGTNKEISLKEAVDMHAGFTFNGTYTRMIDNVMINGKAAEENRILVNQDSIVFEHIETVTDLRKKFDIPHSSQVIVNGSVIDGNCTIQDKDIITIENAVSIGEKSAPKQRGH